MSLPRSLLARIIILHALAVITTAVCLPLLIDRTAIRTATNIQRRSLQDQAMALAGHLKLRSDGSIEAQLPRELGTRYSTSYGRFTFSVYDEAGRERLTMGKSSASSPLAQPTTTGETYTGSLQPPQSVYSGLFPVTIGDQSFMIRLSENLGHGDSLLDDMARTVTWPIMVTMGMLLTSLVIANILIVRWATAPLEATAREASAIGPENLGQRLSTDKTPQEVQPLVAAFNVALDRLEEGFRLQQEFTADAAHELRTPLAVLRARIETMLPTAHQRELIADVEAMTRTLNQLLMVAQLEQPEHEGPRECDVTDVATQEVASIAPLAIASRRTIELSVPDSPVVVRGSAQSHSWAIRNLLENALRHTPENSSVEVVVSADGTVTVGDRGPGIPLADRAKIFQRFWRSDRHDSQHAGLGLSIVHRAVTANGGTIAVEDRTGGGALFRVKLVTLADADRAP